VNAGRGDRAGRLALSLLLLFIVALAAPLVSTRGATPDPGPNPWFRLDAAGEVRVSLWFGWSSTCPHCLRAIPLVEQLGRELPWLDVHALQVDGEDQQAAVETLVHLAASIGEQIGGVPVFLYGGHMRVGFGTAETTGQELRRELVAFRDAVQGSLVSPTPGSTDGLPASPAPSPDGSPVTASPSPSPALPGAQIMFPFIGPVDAASLSLPLLAVTLGGLDAFNPCALSVLFFLMSVLVGARSRRRVLLVGGTFVLVSGLVYFVLMAAWLNLFLAFGALRVVTVAAGIAAVVAALINIKDFGWYGHGPSLVIPGSARPAIFGRILDLSEATKLPVIIATTILVAAVANAYEMLCTGGFPVVFTRVLTLSELPTTAYYGYLALYNLVYVTPLLAIVLLFTWSLGSGRIGELEARRLKLLSGLLMLGFGAMLLFLPDRLGDLSTALALFGSALTAWLLILSIGRLRARRLHASPR
jgi:thiol-disulfide isomerase/thioredoxin